MDESQRLADRSVGGGNGASCRPTTTTSSARIFQGKVHYDGHAPKHKEQHKRSMEEVDEVLPPFGVACYSELTLGPGSASISAKTPLSYSSSRCQGLQDVLPVDVGSLSRYQEEIKPAPVFQAF